MIGAGVLFVAAVRWAPCPDVCHAPLPASFAVTDAAGGVLRQVLAPDGSDCRPVARVGRESWIARAVVAAEDKRFWQHPGVDPLAVCRNRRRGSAPTAIRCGPSSGGPMCSGGCGR